jgi:hypothetical protein
MTTDKKVAYEDVDDVIEAAARAKDQEASFLSVEELQEVAAEIDIPARLLGPAIEQVRKRRELDIARERAAAELAQRRRRLGSYAAAALGVVLLVWGLAARASLRDAMLEAEQQRSQVVNVIDRQLATRAQWADAPESPAKSAELSGAENRVRLERQRYDEIATEYRRRATSLGGRAVVWLGGYPAELPLSSGIDGW